VRASVRIVIDATELHVVAACGTWPPRAADRTARRCIRAAARRRSRLRPTGGAAAAKRPRPPRLFIPW